MSAVVFITALLSIPTVRAAHWLSALLLLGLTSLAVLGQDTQPLVAIHDSEWTRFLDSTNAPALPPTPSGPGTTGFQWWSTHWHYFVMPESVTEALRSDGTACSVISDANIASGLLLTNGQPRFPILISLASEAIRDDEIAPLTNYVAAGGFLLVGSSSFTRTTNGSTRGDFAFANELGLHMVSASVTNWGFNNTVTKQGAHRLTAHLPDGALTWRMPTAAEEIPWGLSPGHPFLAAHDQWRVSASDATVIAQGDAFPFLTVKKYGKGCFIYHAAFQPLMGHNGFAPSMYAYMIFRSAIEWAFENLNLPVPKLSPWPYPYDAAMMARHDLENFTNLVANLSSSAQFEFTNGARGDYYFCTGTLREDASPSFNTNNIIAGLRQAVTNYGATIGPHNGGLKNPYNTNLVRGDYDYWHWGPDEVLDFSPTNYANGKAYASASLSNSFLDVESWLTGITNGLRTWTGCYFNATRENSYDLQAQLKINIAGDQKLTPFPHWTLSTATSGRKYPFLSEPVSDWFVGGLVAQSLEPWHPPGVHTLLTVHEAVDFYYNLGALVGLYSHSLSTGIGDAGQLAPEYIRYTMNTNLHPRLWAANAVSIYRWWMQRSNTQVTASYATNGFQSVATISVTGSVDTNCAVEILVPGSGLACDLQVLTNNVLAGSSVYRSKGQTIRVQVGTTVTNAQLKYLLGPRAVNDIYSANSGATLNVAAPGVLANDGLGLMGGLVTTLVTGPANGTLNLGPNGAFSYSPMPGFLGNDLFTYRVTDGQSNSSTAQVSILVSSSDVLFIEDFTRPGDPGQLTPWVVQAGNWSVTAGSMRGGTNNLFSYSNTYLTNNWTNYSVQASLRFQAGAFGGGLGGRLNAANGAHYAAWIYPENSPGGSNLLKLVKFQNWTSFSYLTGAVMAQTNLAAVSTNYHTVKLAFHGNRIAIYFDGLEKISASDLELQTYPSGGISLDMWTDSAGYFFNADDVLVDPLITGDNYVTSEDIPLAVPASGVLTNDTEVYGTSLTASVLTGPSHGTLDLAADGGFIYLPATNYSGSDSFTYQANDGLMNLGSSTVSLNITPVNDAPILPAQTDRTISELNQIIVTNTATDIDVPANLMSYILANPPTGAAISTNGIITWTPSEIQGPGSNIITTIVTDDGVPPMSATNSFTVVVTEVNSAPLLTVQNDRTIAELTTLTVTNAAVDPDLPANTLSYVLVNPPTGAIVDTNGVIKWTPEEAQGPSINTITTVVTDNGVPPLSATNSFTVAVTEVNSAPLLTMQNDRTIAELTTLTVTNAAVDPDLPANTLSYVLVNPPTGATVDTNGVIRWTPEEAQGPSINTITTVVTDNGLPPLSATNSFTVAVTEVNSPPVLPFQANVVASELTMLIVTNTAVDADIPANLLSYSLIDPPTGVSVNANGLITWRPSEAQGPGNYTIKTIVSDNGKPRLSATNSFLVVVTEVNSAPVLTSQTDRTIDELMTLIVTNAATDSDLPMNSLDYTLINPPTGATIDTNGVINWTPMEAQGPSTNVITTVVTDNGVPPLSVTNSFVVLVSEVNAAPILPFQPDLTIMVSNMLVLTNTATDPDLPANDLTYQLQAAPMGAAIDTNGIITWQPNPEQGGSTNLFETIVTDTGNPPLSATNSFFVFAQGPAAPIPPVVQSISITEGSVFLTWSTVQNRTYRLQYQEAFGDALWTDVSPDMVADGSSLTATNVVGDLPQRFYRVLLLP